MDEIVTRVTLQVSIPVQAFADLVSVCDAHGLTPSDAIEWLIVKEAYAARAALGMVGRLADPDLVPDPMCASRILEA